VAHFTALPDFAVSALATAIKRQPLTPGKVSLAWQMAAGPQLARVAQAELDQQSASSLSLVIRPRDGRWGAEIDRLRPMLTDRLTLLLGNSVTLRIA
jgi:hypothetical protein